MLYYVNKINERKYKMKNFGMILDETASENNWSKSLFAKSLGLNRGNYYKIISGQIRMTEDMFYKMFDNNKFTKIQESLLKEAYWRESYRSDVLEHILFIKDSFDELSKDPVCVKKLGAYTPNSSCDTIIGITSIVKAIEFILNDELENESPQIFTNYPYENKNIDNHVFEILSKSQKKVDFQHIVRFNTDNTSTKNLSNVFSSIKYARMNYNTYYYYINNMLADEIDILYSGFFISSKYVLLLNSSESIGILSSEPDMLKASITAAELVFQRSKPLVSYFENAFTFKNELEKHQIHLTGSFDSIPCIVSYADATIVDAMIRDNIPNRDLIVQSIIHHFSILSGETAKNYDKFYTVSGTKFFADTGETYVAQHDIAPEFPPEIRAVLISRLLEAFKNDLERKMHFIDETKFTIPMSFILECSESAVQIAMTTNNDNSFYGQGLITITDPSILSDFNNFIQYLIKAGYCLPDDYIEFAFKDIVIYLENHNCKSNKN